MSCCGKKRSSASLGAGVYTAPAGIAARGPEFQYLGGSVLTVRGLGTGLEYRFVGYGARASVDPRDRSSLARVPQLREVATHR